MTDPSVAQVYREQEDTAHPRVGIVILHWNNLKDTLACLEAVAKLEYDPILPILVNNGGGPTVKDAARSVLPATVVLTFQENHGCAGGNNRGIRYALENGCDYVWLVNDDVTVAPDSLSLLIEAAIRNPQAGFLGPKILLREDPNRILFGGGFLRGGWRPWFPGAGELDDGQFEGATQVDCLSGCTLLAKKEAIETIGLMDESFFVYYDDTEWCYRCKRQGFQVIYVPAARTWHPDMGKRDEYSAAVTYYMARNSLMYARKHHLGPATFARLLGAYARTWLSWTLRPRWRSKRPQRDALGKAIWDFARGYRGKYPGQVPADAQADSRSLICNGGPGEWKAK